MTVGDYLIWGGFPVRLEQIDAEAARRYLNDLDNTIVINDLIRRYKIRKVALFTALVNYVLRSNARIFSAKAIRDYIKQAHDTCSINTIMKFLGYLREAYIIDGVKLYSAKTKQELAYYEKIYNADVAFNSLRCPDNRYDVTENLENIVYNELAYRGYHLTVYNPQGRGIDFVAEKAGKKYYVRSPTVLRRKKLTTANSARLTRLPSKTAKSSSPMMKLIIRRATSSISG